MERNHPLSASAPGSADDEAFPELMGSFLQCSVL
jgi:hypothetical protein